MKVLQGLRSQEKRWHRDRARQNSMRTRTYLTFNPGTIGMLAFWCAAAALATNDAADPKAEACAAEGAAG